MVEITAALVKELREQTGAGMMDCKKALSESGGSLEASIDWLRTQGLSAAAKKSGREASEGLVGVVTQGTKGSLLEVNAETDFVARNEEFQKFVQAVTDISLEDDCTLDELKRANYPGGDMTVGTVLTNLIATLGENIELRRTAILKVKNGIVSSYMHNSLKPGIGKIGVLVAIESNGNRTFLGTLGKQLSMHVAAANPHVLSRGDLDPLELEHEKRILADQAQGSGKADAIIEKIVEGRLRKYYEEVCLLDQIFVVDGETKVSKVIQAASEEITTPVEITGFVRFALGEGIDKKKKDFAVEVAETLQG